MKTKLLALILLSMLCLTACTPDDVSFYPSGEEVTTKDTEATERLPLPEVDGSLSFTDSLMKLTAADGNRMISPYSAKMCLALLANGADGDTKSQILEAVGITDLDSYNAEVEKLLARYATYAGVMSLETANSLWINQTEFGGKGEFLMGYREAMEKFYSAEVREVESKNSVEEVNAWVNEKTKEKIPTILSEEHRNFATALVNAVYFKAAWEEEFSKNLTDKMDFNNVDGTVLTLDFMHKTEYLDYCEKDGVKAIKLDYSRYASDELYVDDMDYSFSMYIMLGDDVNVEEFLNSATFENKRVALAIPKFRIEYSVGLTDILKALGMMDAFDAGKANLGKMMDLEKLSGNLFVSDVLQKTYIDVDEKGTEAAAVTAILAKCTSVMISQPDPIVFTADRPFYFAIRDNTSGDILFAGRYETGK